MSLQKITMALARVLVTICLPLTLVLVSVDIIASNAYIRHEYGLPGFPPSGLYPPDERLRLAEATLCYLRSSESTDHLRELEYSGEPVYNPREVQHLVDVKAVMKGVFLAEKAGIVVLSAALICLLGVGKDRVTTLRSVVLGCSLLWGLALVVGAIALVSFDWFFTQFHRMFFEDGTWVFYVTDTLIQLFPLPFWMDATWKIGALALGSAALLGGICDRMARRKPGQSQVARGGKA